MWNTRDWSNYRDKKLLLTKYPSDLDGQIAMVVKGNRKQGKAVVGGNKEQGRATTVALGENKN